LKSGFEDALVVAALEVVDKRDDAEVTEEIEDVWVAVDVELTEEGTVPLRIYNESRLPAPVEFVKKLFDLGTRYCLPQNSELLPAQLMLQLLSGSRTLVLPRTFPQ
jgi:hypothetical protein